MIGGFRIEWRTLYHRGKGNSIEHLCRLRECSNTRKRQRRVYKERVAWHAQMRGEHTCLMATSIPFSTSKKVHSKLVGRTLNCEHRHLTALQVVWLMVHRSFSSLFPKASEYTPESMSRVLPERCFFLHAPEPLASSASGTHGRGILGMVRLRNLGNAAY